MVYKALYRTYRPNTFDEVAGQNHIVKTLENALATNKLAHAYLFAGPRGTGKTTMAKLLAKSLNCDKGIGHQCNECKNCRAIIDGTHPDVLELDAASNNGVDEIRELIDKVKYGTILGRYKVYIIDEVHMLSTGAFNALLKTLEEPPSHVVFILATTEPHKILPTILSRCQRYDFTKLSDKDIKNRLKEILEIEQIEYNEEAVNIIISLADGSMRDALSILDQVLAYSNNKLVVDDILDIFALESKEEKISLLNSIISKDINDVLERINNYIFLGTDIKRLTDDLLLMLKDILIYHSSRNTNCFEVLTEQEAISYINTLDIDETLRMIDVIMEAQKDYKNVASIVPLFQVAILKLIALKKDGSPNKAAINSAIEEKAVEQPSTVTKPVDKVPLVDKSETVSLFDYKEEPQEIPVKLSKNILTIKGIVKDDSFYIDDGLMIDIMVVAKKDIKKQLINNWGNLNKIIAHPTLGKSATMLIDGRPLVASQKILVVEYQFQNVAEKANLLANQEDIQNVVKSVFGKKMFVYAVSRKESIRLQQNYLNKLQLSLLPKANSIKIEFEGE
ncbi:MAG TPA: DNA polymerase III subunit gamma/tau [Erysipelotrichaceae bacterium]|nr:DNA polymerase III subunit gamma/tau [Erysipelotrichaceae bacterium]